MTWHYFLAFAILSALLWAGGAWASWKDKSRRAYTLTGLGLAVFFMYILWMWITLDRPPLRTMGETRLWYSLFLPLAGLIVYSRWRYKWILPLSTLLSLVFICINILKPEIHSKTLMPALQSPWFAPHVIVYMFAYALLGAAFVISAYLLFIKRQKASLDEMGICDNLTYGFPDNRHTLRRTVGKRSLGTLLGMGSQGNVGRGHMAGLSGLHPPATGRQRKLKGRAVDTRHQLRAAADVLVGHQFPAVGTGSQHTYL